MINRRKFIALLGAITAAVPVLARAKNTQAMGEDALVMPLVEGVPAFNEPNFNPDRECSWLYKYIDRDAFEDELPDEIVAEAVRDYQRMIPADYRHQLTFHHVPAHIPDKADPLGTYGSYAWKYTPDRTGWILEKEWRYEDGTAEAYSKTKRPSRDNPTLHYDVWYKPDGTRAPEAFHGGVQV